MKHFYLKSFLFLCLFILIGQKSFAVVYDNYYYNNGVYYGLDENPGGTTGIAYVIAGSWEGEYAGEIRIPTSFWIDSKRYIVLGIDKNAMKDCKNVTSVSIASSVITIDVSAFEGCTGLKSIEFGNNNKLSIASSAFKGCSSLEKVIIPSIDVWLIINFENDDANPLSFAHHLYNNKNEEITYVTIPTTVSEIKQYAFNGFTGLNYIKIPNTITSIGYSAFKDCVNLKTLYIDDIESWCKIEISNIDANPLYFSHNLCANGLEVTKLVFPSSIKEINNFVFAGFNSLLSVNLDGYVTKIGRGAFSECSGLTELTISNNIEAIMDEAFSNCENLTEVNINCKIPVTGAWFGRRNNYIKKIVIGDNVTEMQDYAFQGFENLTEVFIGGNINKIGSHAFSLCANMDSITVAEDNKIFDSRGGCNAILNTESNAVVVGCKKTVIPSSAKAINGYAFEGSGIKDIIIPDAIETIGTSAFSGCKDLNYAKIGNGVKEIGYYAFEGSGLMSLNIPNGTEKLGAGVFKNCKSLETVGIPGSIKEVPESAFEGSGLKSIVIPNGTESIGLRAFKDCNSLETVVIPNTITTIGSNAFANCLSLYSVTSLINMPFKLNETAFQYTGSDYSKDIVYMAATLYVPRGRTAMYSNVEGWKKFLNIMETDTKFKLTYMVDGEEYKTYEIQAAEIITPEPDPYKEGYIFSGWSDIPYLMPAHDVTVTGSFTLDMTGIDATATENATPKVYYTIDGHRLNGQKRGLNIIRMSDGTVRKVMVK